MGQETKLNLVWLIISENKDRVRGSGQDLSRVRVGQGLSRVRVGQGLSWVNISTASYPGHLGEERHSTSPRGGEVRMAVVQYKRTC